MYDKLVNWLREPCQYENCVLCQDAADAIEELQAAKCPHYIRNIHDRGDDSLCEKWGCEVKEVQPVRHGRWINHGWSTVCSECGEDYAFAKRNYCPNCGARMREPPKEET